MTRTTRRLIVAALALAPAACSGLLGGGGPPTALYNLTAVSLPAGPRLNREILIDKPNATDALDTRRIALRRNQLSFNYFAEASWTDPAPAMIHALLIESMQRSGRVKAVSRNTTAILGDYELRVDVRRFEADYAGDVEVPTVRIEFGLILVHVEDRAVVGTHSVTASARPGANDVPSVVAAFDQALHDAMRDTLTWTLATAR